MPLDISSPEVNDCPFKDKNCKWRFLFFSKYKDYNLPIYQCHCGLQTIHPKSNEVQELYNEAYYTGKAEYSYKDERQTEHYDAYVWDARIRNIQKFVPTGNFLDIGCAFGGFLARTKEFGFTPFGVEISSYAAEYAKKRGIQVYSGNFLDIDLPENFFQVITLVEVLEHLPYPEKVFDKLVKILAKGGLLLIQTANFNGKQAKEEGSKYHYYLPGHLYYYSDSLLIEILKERGIQDFKIYYGVDFPLLAKLQKSRGGFKTWKEYFAWWRISKYHLKSKFFPGSTSSMVFYAFKK
ncbi:MAG: class I SAM-dependent methyltransferase [Leptospiraceae bacterium]|nr:class I SAM-dependent methyltransferase [Leptospiraceae bacterium]